LYVQMTGDLENYNISLAKKPKWNDSTEPIQMTIGEENTAGTPSITRLYSTSIF
jgi:hypothetical protein